MASKRFMGWILPAETCLEQLLKQPGYFNRPGTVGRSFRLPVDTFDLSVLGLHLFGQLLCPSIIACGIP